MALFCSIASNHLQAQERVEDPKPQLSDVTCYKAQDTLQISTDGLPDANECLDGLRWPPGKFEVRVVGDIHAPGALAVQFPSPRPSGTGKIDQVHIEWFAARDAETGHVLRRPAIIIVHESGSGMKVGRFIARELGRRGVHGFLVQLPGYGQRKTAEAGSPDLVAVFKQGVADVRRARDAVAALPEVDARHIGLQGTSLGGFIATLAGSLDNKFDSVFLLLCGGDLHGVLTHGGQDARRALDRLLASGVGVEQLPEVLRGVEPLRLAHRLRRERTWLYVGTFDDVVPAQFSDQLAKAIGLPSERHVKMLATHYSGIVFLPGVLEKMKQTALAE